MKRFIDCVQLMYRERFDVIIERIISKQNICALFSLEPISNSMKFILELRKKSFNINTLITINSSDIISSSDIRIVDFKNFDTIKPLPSVIFVKDDVEYKIAFSQLDKGIEIINLGKNLQRSRDAYKSYMEHISDLYDVYNLFIDEESKKAFCGYLLAKVSSKLSYAVHANTPQYVCAGFAPKKDDILIDGGSCDGSTAARFSDMGCKVFAFEMDKINYAMAAELAKKKGFVVENLGLGSYNHDSHYTHIEGNIGASKIAKDGNNITSIVTLDLYVANNKIPRVDFIKLDTEGAELNILRGATDTIARYKPRLAISAYHKLNDLWVLTKFVKSIRPDYEFAFRHYAAANEDGPFFVTREIQDLFSEFDLDTKLPTFCDCVLLCR